MIEGICQYFTGSESVIRADPCISLNARLPDIIYRIPFWSNDPVTDLINSLNIDQKYIDIL